MSIQQELLPLPTAGEQERATHRSGAPRRPKVKTIDRKQSLLVPLDVEALVAPDHKVRAIWELAGKMNLSRFEEQMVSVEGKAGRPSWDPRLLVSVWVYSYSEGINAAREIERLMQWEPGLLWLAGLGVVNHTTLSDFRVRHQKALEEVFAQLLALLEEGGFVDLETVMHDGTKIRAQAGADTFRRQAAREKLEQNERLGVVNHSGMIVQHRERYRLSFRDRIVVAYPHGEVKPGLWIGGKVDDRPFVNGSVGDLDMISFQSH